MINSVAIKLTSTVCALLVSAKGGGEYSKFFSDYSTIFNAVAAAELFRFFLSLELKNSFAKAISCLGKYSIGIYMIHEFPYLRNFVWHEVFQPMNYVHSTMLFVYMVYCAVCVSIVGIAIEIIRKTCFSIILDSDHLKCLFKRLDEKMLVK